MTSFDWASLPMLVVLLGLFARCAAEAFSEVKDD